MSRPLHCLPAGSAEQAHRNGVFAAQRGWRYVDGALDPRAGDDPEVAAMLLAYRTGYLAELARIANRKATPEQRAFLAAHAEVARAWRDSIGPDGFIVHGALRFAAAQERLYSMAPWSVLGLRHQEFANPNRQAYGR